MNNEPTLSYQHASVVGASPVGQIVALYDTILRDFGRALVAQKVRNIEARDFELNHALTVIGHLQCVLDHEHGGEPAKHFEQFYNVTRGMIVRACARATPEAIEELIELYAGVRQAWYRADQKMKVSEQSEPAAAESAGGSTTPGVPTPADDDVESSQLQWRA